MMQNAIVCGRPKTAVARRAVSVLSEILLDAYGEYPVVVPTDADAPQGSRLFRIGTRQNNPALADLLPPAPAESYRIRVRDGVVSIVGSDDGGTLYGCVDFRTRFLLPLCAPGFDLLPKRPPDGELPDFECESSPATVDRGVWSWGHVVYDFRRFIDNMVRLKMNTLILWNDAPPFYAREMVDYAHENNVRILWGFAWGWDTDCKKITPSTLSALSPETFREYEQKYAPLGGDGIYFQSFTERDDDEVDGRPIASIVTDFVNATAALFFEKYPDLRLEFGLHATSVRGHLDDIARVDPRIRVVWENCGSFPFSYMPADVSDADETRAFVKKIASLRGSDERFGAVTKGFTKLDWTTFRHLDGSVASGRSSDRFRADRCAKKRDVWRFLQAGWLKNGEVALSIIRAMQSVGREIELTALVEDGLFEERIPFPVALCAEMFWDAVDPYPEILYRTAQRPDVEFV